ncbi:MAG TPA: hypothetical protein PLF13_11185 [candidate division Zixibacteria bacterium]|nr:hypothetical protein [candidate division Zixibacteria bacterium]
MVVVKQLTKCPFCLEPIAAGATRCKHCQADLSSNRKKKAFIYKLNTFRTGFLTGVLFSLLLVIIIWFHFWSGD